MQQTRIKTIFTFFSEKNVSLQQITNKMEASKLRGLGRKSNEKVFLKKNRSIPNIEKETLISIYYFLRLETIL